MKLPGLLLKTLIFCSATSFLLSQSLAHHSYTMFDMETELVFKGEVVDYMWRSPHSHIVINVVAGDDVDPATVGTWDIEGASPAIMTRQGWNRVTFQPGQAITLVARPMRDGSKGAALFYAIRDDGSCLFMDIARPVDNSLCEAQ